MNIFKYLPPYTDRCYAIQQFFIPGSIFSATDASGTRHV